MSTANYEARSLPIPCTAGEFFMFWHAQPLHASERQNPELLVVGLQYHNIWLPDGSAGWEMHVVLSDGRVVNTRSQSAEIPSQEKINNLCGKH